MTPRDIYDGITADALDTKSHLVTDAVHAIADWGFDDAHIRDAKSAVVSCIDSDLETAGAAAVHVTWNGTNPSASLGHPLPAGGSLTISRVRNIDRLKFVRVGSKSCYVTITLQG